MRGRGDTRGCTRARFLRRRPAVPESFKVNLQMVESMAVFIAVKKLVKDNITIPNTEGRVQILHRSPIKSQYGRDVKALSVTVP
jgi:hypothetical protein